MPESVDGEKNLQIVFVCPGCQKQFSVDAKETIFESLRIGQNYHGPKKDECQSVQSKPRTVDNRYVCDACFGVFLAKSCRTVPVSIDCLLVPVGENVIGESKRNPCSNCHDTINGATWVLMVALKHDFARTGVQLCDRCAVPT